MDTLVIHGWRCGCGQPTSKEPFILHDRRFTALVLPARLLASLPTTLTSYEQLLLAVTENIGARYQEAMEPRFVGSILKAHISQRNTREPKTLLYEDPRMDEFRVAAKSANSL